MQAFPHNYSVELNCTPEGDITTESQGLPAIQAAAPAEFDGPGDRWSPETLLVAALADCFALTFRAVAQASKLEWHTLACTAAGTLDNVERKTKFTSFTIKAVLTLSSGASESMASRLLEKAEANCLITNSLNADVTLETSLCYA